MVETPPGLQLNVTTPIYPLAVDAPELQLPATTKEACTSCLLRAVVLVTSLNMITKSTYKNTAYHCASSSRGLESMMVE